MALRAVLSAEDPGPGRGWRGLPTEAALVATALLVNLAVRRHTRDAGDVATGHGQDILDLERALGVDWEQAVQDAALDVPGLGHLASYYYVWGYLPVIAATMVWLYLRRPRGYRVLRNALLLSGAVGVTVYALYPTAPPRLMESGFVDTVARHSLDAAARPAGIANEIAAVPSFHVGWLVLAMTVLFWSVRHWWLRALCVLHPLGMVWSVVASGNHWLLDLPAGLVVAGAGLWASVRWESRHPSGDSSTPDRTDRVRA